MTNNMKLQNSSSNSLRFSRRWLAVPALTAALALGAVPAMAQSGNAGGFTGPGSTTTHQGGYTGPGPALVTVDQAKGMRDDSRVAIRGNIVQSLGGEDYVFQDETGSVTVDIDRKVWGGLQIGQGDLVEIHGEVDKDWNRTEIDVKRVIKIK